MGRRRADESSGTSARVIIDVVVGDIHCATSRRAADAAPVAIAVARRARLLVAPVVVVGERKRDRQTDRAAVPIART